jgi:hypothetical protein
LVSSSAWLSEPTSLRAANISPIGVARTKEADAGHRVCRIRQRVYPRRQRPLGKSAVSAFAGEVGQVSVKTGVQVEVDWRDNVIAPSRLRLGLGCEGRSDIVLIEAKVGQPSDFITRQLFYPYRKWKLEIPQKRVRPWPARPN